MRPVARRRSGSWAHAGQRRAVSQQAALHEWEQEWQRAAATDALEARPRLLLLVVLTAGAALANGLVPLRPGFSGSNSTAAVVAAGLAAAIAMAVVPVGDRFGRGLSGAGAGDRLVYVAALASVVAAAVHLSVAKMHFDEYFLFGLFFVGSGIAQVIWPLWLLLRRWTPLLTLGAAGNALIVALWAVDRTWGLPLGPTPWQPDPIGFGDTVASGAEVVLVAACIAAWAGGRARHLRTPAVVLLTLLAFALTTLSLLSVLGVAPSLLPSTA